MKKTIRMFLIPIMLICLLSGITVSATDSEVPSETTENIPIDSVTLSFSAPAVGAQALLPAVPSDARYSIDATSSWWYEHASSRAMSSDQEFMSGTSYELILKIVPAEGYAFNEETQFVLNGQPVAPAAIAADSLTYYSDVWHLRHPIARTDVFYTAPVAGSAAALPTVPGDDGYRLDPEVTYWQNETTGESLQIGDLFEAGSSYKLYFGIRTDLAFTFTEDTTLYVNSTSAEISNRTDSLIQYGSAAFALPSADEGTDTPPAETTPSQPSSDKKPSHQLDDVPRTGDTGFNRLLATASLSLLALILLVGFVLPQKAR